MIRKKNKDYTFILGVVVGLLISGLVVYAASISSSNVSYDNKTSGLTSTTVKGAIDELYQKSNSCYSPQVSGNYVFAYTYNQTSGDANYCITGEEPTCKKTDCYKNKEEGSCDAGTIIGYKVNNSTIKYFHVIHDDGNTMTMQQRENTIYNIPWHDFGSTDYGPLTILPKLEEATASWSNVENRPYIMGETVFAGGNANTGCKLTTFDFDGDYEHGICTNNAYTLPERTARARMITVQEAVSLGCATDNSCPIWMNNYLYDSTSYGGTVDDDHTENGAEHNFGYWTMSADADWSTMAGYVGGRVNFAIAQDTSFGARAVVVVSK